MLRVWKRCAAAHGKTEPENAAIPTMARLHRDYHQPGASMNPRLLVSIAALAAVAVTAGCNSKPAPTNPSPTDAAATLAVAHTPGPDQSAPSANSVDWSCLAQSVAGASGATWRT